MAIDWPALRSAAAQMTEQAYAPYSRLRVGAAGVTGDGRVVTGDGQRLLPCGRCRQLLMEAGGPSLLVDTATGPAELARLLPSAFTSADLPRREDAGD